MKLDYKFMKENLFDPYRKYWIIFFAIIIIFLFIRRQNYFNKNNNISSVVEGMEYVGSGVVINAKYVLTNKNIIENACWSSKRLIQGKFYVVTDRFIYPVNVTKKDAFSGLILLRLTDESNKFKNYSIIQFTDVEPKINSYMVIAKPVNQAGTFKFQHARVINNIEKHDFYITSRAISKKNNIIGMPVFNKNFVLQGIIKKYEPTLAKGKKDEFLEKLEIQQTYSVTNSNIIKKFLKKNRIYFEQVDAVNSLDNTKYNIKKSIVNIICKKVY